MIAVDGSVWIRAALAASQADSMVVSQFHALPMVPVTNVVDDVMKRIATLEKAGFIIIFVLDGQRFPLKREETDACSADKDLDVLYTDLYQAYMDPDEYSQEKVYKLRKSYVYPREDVYYKVVEGLRRSGVLVICGPFKADHQLQALQNQGIIDATVLPDTDLIGQGVRYTVKSFTLGGFCYVMTLDTLRKEVLPRHLYPKKTIARLTPFPSLEFGEVEAELHTQHHPYC